MAKLLSSLYLPDNVEKFVKHDFTEVVRFDVNNKDS
tara:strand:- start:93 stop:200 length:108 start_codon:yes stop_codon:yes gene_type:complete